MEKHLSSLIGNPVCKLILPANFRQLPSPPSFPPSLLSFLFILSRIYSSLPLFLSFFCPTFLSCFPLLSFLLFPCISFFPFLFFFLSFLQLYITHSFSRFSAIFSHCGMDTNQLVNPYLYQSDLGHQESNIIK